jgi:hypothetical protein
MHDEVWIIYHHNCKPNAIEMQHIVRLNLEIGILQKKNTYHILISNVVNYIGRWFPIRKMLHSK